MRQLAFVDPGLSDIPVLLGNLQPGVEAIVLDPRQPGPAQIAAALEQRPRPAAVHILAHGRAGEISFSAGPLSRATLQEHAADLARIGRALDGGGLNLWSCRSAQGDVGQDFAEALADAAGAPVAAATELVGAAALGGHWALDSRVGDVDVVVPLTSPGIEAYAAVLETKTFVGAAPTSQWNDPDNWDPVGIPQNGDDVIVDTLGHVIYMSNNTATLASLAITATSVILIGTTLDVSGGTGITLDAQSQLLGFGTIAGDVSGTGGIAASSGTLILSGTISGPSFSFNTSNPNPVTLRFTGTATTSSAIVLDSANQTLEVGAGGSLTIDAAESITNGTIKLTGGTLTDAAGVTIGSGATLTGFGTVTNGVTVDGGTITVTGPTLSIGGTVFNEGAVLVDTSTLAGAATLSGSVLENDGGLLSIVGVAARQATVTLTSAAGLGADGIIFGDVELTGNALLEFGSGTIDTIDQYASLRLDGAQAHVTAADAAPDAPENSALIGLAANHGILQLSDGASVTTVGADLDNDGLILVDALAGEGGSTLEIGGKLTNTGTVAVGNATLSGPTMLTADAIDNDCGCGSLLIVGGETEQATVSIGSTAGFGTDGTLVGGVELSGKAVLEFASGTIGTIEWGGALWLDGALAQINTASADPLVKNSALTGLLLNEGALRLSNGAEVTTDGDLKNDDSGGIFVDAFDGEGGSTLEIGGKLTNVGLLYVGSETLTDSATLTATSIDNDCGCGELSIVGGDIEQATAAFASTAGFGIAGSLIGYVELSGNALISFTGGTIDTIMADSTLWLDGAQARVAVTGALDENSALTGLTDNEGTLDLSGGATVAITGTLANSGWLQVDGSPGDEGGSTLQIGGALVNTSVVALGNINQDGSSTISANSLVNQVTGWIDLYGNATTQALLDVGSVTNSGIVSVHDGGVLDIAGDLEMDGDSALTVESDGTLMTGASTIVLKTGDGTTSIIDLQDRSFDVRHAIVVESGALQFTGTEGLATPELTGAGLIQGEISLDGSNVLTIIPTGQVVGTSHVYHFWHTDLGLAYTEVLAADGSMKITGSDRGEVLTGGAFNDRITGGTGADTLYGEDGNDRLNGGGGLDSMTGGAGNDIYYVEDYFDQVFESIDGGKDTVYASVDYDLAAGQEIEYLRANAGTVGLTLGGNEFNNTLVGGVGDDTLNGGDGNDRLYGNDGADTLNGGVGADRLYGRDGVDALNGGDDNDRLDGGAGADVMTGGTGNDTYFVDDPGDQVIETADEGTDTIYTGIDYSLTDTQEIEYLRANAGTVGLTLGGNQLDNTLVGSAGDDTLNGGDGDDKLYGNDGADTLNGGAGANRLYGGDGADELNGGEDNDRLDGGAGADVMTGGAGNDTYFVDDPGDQVIETTGQGTDTIYTSIDYSLTDSQEIEYLRADAGTAGLTLGGNLLNNTLAGGAGDDVLNGGDGNDRLYGEDGADTLDGGTGNDRLYGGDGDDVFVFDTPFIGVANVDTIADFDVARDAIRLDLAYFAGLAHSFGHLSASAFAIDSATGTDPQIVYNSATGTLTYDSNGAASGGASSFAKVTGIPALTADSFLVV